jgi:hypothetical protein
MRRQTHDANLYFRAPAWIVSAAEAEARRRGMGLSELLRAALRRELQDAA